MLTIPASRPVPDDKTKVFFSEGRSGHPPALHFWFPPGDTRGYEFVSAPVMPISDSTWRAPEFQSRPNGGRGAQPKSNPVDSYAVQQVLQLIEKGKFGAARDGFRRNYFLANNRDGASVSFLLALVMRDRIEAYRSLRPRQSI